MWLVDELAEARIAEAERLGEFDHLPGRGERLDLDRDELVPEDLRSAYRLLKNAGYVPPEMTLLSEIRQVEQLLPAMDDGAAKSGAIKRLNLLRAHLGARARQLDASLEYSCRLVEKLGGAED